MANVSFAAFEAVINMNGAPVAVVELFTAEKVDDLVEVPQVGSRKPADLKETSQHVTWACKRAYFKDASAGDLFTNAKPDANQYLPTFTMTVPITDKSAGAPGVAQTYTLTGCKCGKYGLQIPTGKGVIVENVEGIALDLTRA